MLWVNAWVEHQLEWLLRNRSLPRETIGNELMALELSKNSTHNFSRGLPEQY